MRLTDIPEITKLSTAEKILLVEDIWDNIALEDSTVLVPQSHIDELETRFKKYQTDPGNLLTLDELRERVAVRK